MTEIKRLSDEDIEKLKNAHEVSCDNCIIEKECIGGGECDNLKCEATVSHFIRLEMEAREESGVK